jgi:tetratricopeptide (TPR) repeat protein
VNSSTSYFDYLKRLLVNELKDEQQASMKNVLDNKKYVNLVFVECRDHEKYMYKFVFKTDKNSTEDIIRMDDIVWVKSDKRSFVGVVCKAPLATHPSKQYDILVLPTESDVELWKDEKFRSYRCYHLVSMGPLKRRYATLSPGYFPNQEFDAALIRGQADNAPPENPPENPSELNAVQWAAMWDFLRCQDNQWRIWMAPAGTGKSTVIVETIYEAIKQNSNQVILATAPSNKATLALLQKFVGKYPDVPVCFLGNRKKMQEHAQDLEALLCESEKDLDKKQVVFSTLSSSTRYAKNLNVKLLIIDEAGQATESEARIPLKHNPAKILLVGDPKQLPPTIKSKRVEAAGGRSLLDRLISNGNDFHFFCDGYRMDPNINRWPSKEFYKNMLKASYYPCVSITGPSASLRVPPYLFIDVSNGTERSAGNGSYANQQEVNAVVWAVKNIFLKDATMQTVAIITPYQGQVDLLMKCFSSPQLKPRLQIGTIDSFQGSEADVVLLSLVRANDPGEVGFVDSKNRLNVAVTRAKRGLYVFGNAKTLRSSKTCRSLISDAKKRKCFLYSWTQLKDSKRLLKHTVSDRLAQLNKEPSSIPPLQLAFQAYRYGIENKSFPNPLERDNNSIIITPSKQQNMGGMLDVCYGAMKYRWDGIGKRLVFMKFNWQEFCKYLPAELREYFPTDQTQERYEFEPADAVKIWVIIQQACTGEQPQPIELDFVTRFQNQGPVMALTEPEVVPGFIPSKLSHDAKLAIDHFGRNEFESAANLYNRIGSFTESEKKNVKIQAWAGRLSAWALYRQYGRPKFAVEVLEALILLPDLLDPVLCQLYSDLGWMLYRMEKIEEALKSYQEAESRAPYADFANRNIDLHHRLGLLYEAKGEPNEALKHYQQSHQCHYPSFLRQAEIANALKDHDSFEKFIQKAKEALKLLYKNRARDRQHGYAQQEIQKVEEAGRF